MFACMCLYVCVHMFACMYVNVRVHMFVCMYLYVCVHMFVCMYLYVRVHMFACIYLYVRVHTRQNMKVELLRGEGGCLHTLSAAQLEGLAKLHKAQTLAIQKILQQKKSHGRATMCINHTMKTMILN